MKTTINIKMMMEKNACDEAQRAIRCAVGDSTITLVQALDATSMQDAFWWFRTNDLTPDQERDLRLLACDYAEHVLNIFEDKYPDDNRPRHAIETTRLYAVGQATKEELEKARSAADAAADAAAYAAYAAAAYAAYAAYTCTYAAYTCTYAADAARADSAARAARAARAYAATEREYQTEKLRELLTEWCAS